MTSVSLSLCYLSSESHIIKKKKNNKKYHILSLGMQVCSRLHCFTEVTFFFRGARIFARGVGCYAMPAAATPPRPGPVGADVLFSHTWLPSRAGPLGLTDPLTFPPGRRGVSVPKRPRADRRTTGQLLHMRPDCTPRLSLAPSLVRELLSIKK